MKNVCAQADLVLTSSLFTLAAHLCASSPARALSRSSAAARSFLRLRPLLSRRHRHGHSPAPPPSPRTRRHRNRSRSRSRCLFRILCRQRSKIVSCAIFNQSLQSTMVKHEMQVLLARAGLGTPSSAAFSRCRRASAGDIGAASTSFAFGVGSRSTQHLPPKHDHFQNPFAQPSWACGSVGSQGQDAPCQEGWVGRWWGTWWG